MKRLIAILLICSLLVGCSSGTPNHSNSTPTNEKITTTTTFLAPTNAAFWESVEESAYSDLVLQLNSENYFVENIDTVYISREYLEELEYNSMSNVFFGYTLSELNECFQDTRYVFTLDEDGQTIVKEFEKYDDTYLKAFKNVAIGTGVILFCVTVSVASSAVGAEAISIFFATAAVNGVKDAVTDGVIGGIFTGIITGIETKDFDQALKSAVTVGSEGFKWGAITGTIEGLSTSTIGLYGATRNGLSWNEAARIQRESNLPLEFIKNLHSVDEYEVLKNADVNLQKVNGKFALTQTIDWDFIGDIDDGRTNAQRVLDGLAPLDSTGKTYQLHHIGQKQDSPLAILTSSQHQGNYSILHANTGDSPSEIDRDLFAEERKSFWKEFLKLTQ